MLSLWTVSKSLTRDWNSSNDCGRSAGQQRALSNGVLGLRPNTTSNGIFSVVLCTDVLMAKATSFRWMSQSLWSIFTYAAMANARVRLTRSTKPGVCGCSPVANTCLMFNLSIASAVTLAVKAVPWSEMIRAGQLCVNTIICKEFNRFLCCCVWNGCYFNILRQGVYGDNDVLISPCCLLEGTQMIDYD